MLNNTEYFVRGIFPGMVCMVYYCLLYYCCVLLIGTCVCWCRRGLSLYLADIHNVEKKYGVFFPRNLGFA